MITKDICMILCPRGPFVQCANAFHKFCRLGPMPCKSKLYKLGLCHVSVPFFSCRQPWVVHTVLVLFGNAAHCGYLEETSSVSGSKALLRPANLYHANLRMLLWPLGLNLPGIPKPRSRHVDQRESAVHPRSPRGLLGLAIS